MKKLFALVLSFVLAASAFAEFHVAPGFRFSIFGPDIDCSFCIDDLDITAGCAFSRVGSDYYDSDASKTVVEYSGILTPNISIGWNYDAFDTGWHNTISAMYYAPMFFSENKFYHMAGLSYRGSIRFHNHLELTITSLLPFFVIESGEENPFQFTIADEVGFWESIGIGFIMSSVGLRFVF